MMQTFHFARKFLNQLIFYPFLDGPGDLLNESHLEYGIDQF